MEGGVIGLLILIADIYAIIKIVQSSAPTTNKVIWVVIVMLLPLVGVVAWYLIGPGGRSG